MRRLLLTLLTLLVARRPRPGGDPRDRDRRRPDPDRRRAAGRPGRGRVARDGRRHGADLRAVVADRARAAAARLRRRPTRTTRTTSGSTLDDAVDRVRAAGMKVTLTVTGPGPAWTSALAGPAAGTVEAAAVRLRRVRDRRREAVRLARRPLHPLERAEHLDLAVAAGSLHARPLHARLAAPLPRAGPRRVPRHRRPRPRRRDRDRRAVAARPAAAQREHGDAAAALPARGSAAAPTAQRHDARASAAASSRRPATASRSTPTAAARRPSAAPERRRRRPLPDPQPVGHARPAQAREGHQVHQPRLPIFIDEYGYQTNPPDRIAGHQAAARRTPGSSAPPTSPGARRGSSSSRSTCGATSRAARTALSGWQSGLRFTGGRAKPSLAHFDTPFALDAANRRLWGQVRPGGAHTVTVERRAEGGVGRLAVTRQRRATGLRRPLAQAAHTATGPTA